MQHRDPTRSVVVTTWFTAAQAQSVPISGVMLKTMAEELSNETGSNSIGHLEIEVLNIPSLKHLLSKVMLVNLVIYNSYFPSYITVIYMIHVCMYTCTLYNSCIWLCGY